jgi:cation transport protein ChaC
MAITRADLEQDRVRAALANTPLARELLSPAALEHSLRQALRGRRKGNDVWLFAYGSLVCNPMLRYAERQLATLYGYHRGFYLLSRINRGTPAQPGLVLGLDRGGSCRGMAYRVAAEHAEHELRMVWRREMLLGSYEPRWLSVRVHGKRTHALAFVVRRSASGYVGRLGEDAIIARIARASGFYGSGADYLLATADGLARHGIRDPKLERLRHLLLGALRQLGGVDEPGGA